MKINDLPRKWLHFHEQRGIFFNVTVGVGLSAAVGMVEHVLGKDLSLAIFYLLPIAFSAWFTGRTGSIFISLICTAAWTWSKSFTSIISLKSFSVFGTYVVMSLLIVKIRHMLEHERNMSRTDHLTGAVNRRAFNEAAIVEIARMSRNHTPLTIAYMDVDNFKEINDLNGHMSGDLLLQMIAKTLLINLRCTDVVARFGGDEFVIMLPNTGQDAARTVMPELIEQLHRSLKDHNWQITFSVGALTCLTPPKTTDQMITLADDLMYEIKKKGKNCICYGIYDKKFKELKIKEADMKRGTRKTPTKSVAGIANQ
jgi:diguanylate cyclase (GGDEF)-like protein